MIGHSRVPMLGSMYRCIFARVMDWDGKWDVHVDLVGHAR